MPGGWTMSMAWMRMPGQTWLDAGSSFVLMWAAMMVPMMLPSLVPILWRYGQAFDRTSRTRISLLTTIAGTAYFVVWTMFGVAVYPIGMALAGMEMQQPSLSRAVPFVAAVIIVIAGALQFTAWKARQIACSRESSVPVDAATAGISSAWRYGVRLGLDCGRCCANLMVILLVLGVMDLRVMALVTAGITVERLARSGERAARAIGAVAVCAGLFLIARAAGLA